MNFDGQDIVTLYMEAHSGGMFSSAGHHALLAGYAASGRPLYTASIRSSVDSYDFSGASVAIPDGVPLEEIKLKSHKADGSMAITALSHVDYIDFDVLRYDSPAYDLCDYCSTRGKEAGGMDATGPFAWTFHRKLPDIKPRERISLNEASILAPRRIWLDVVIESDEEEAIKDESKNRTR